MSKIPKHKICVSNDPDNRVHDTLSLALEWTHHLTPYINLPQCKHSLCNTLEILNEMNLPMRREVTCQGLISIKSKNKTHS